MAQAAIAEGKVYLDGKPLRRPAEQVAEGEHTVEVQRPDALCQPGRTQAGWCTGCLRTGCDRSARPDIGALDRRIHRCAASPGGYSWSLPSDAGEGQLHESLRIDPRVLCLEHCNARALGDAPLQPPYEIAVMDVSFISQTYILPGLAAILPESGCAVTLIKPQFEAGREAVGRGGIVHREADRMAAILRVLDCAAQNRLRCAGLIRSPIDGGDGNPVSISST